MKTKPIKALILNIIIVLFFSALPLSADNQDINIVLTGFNKMGVNDPHNYLSELISSVIREDLSNAEGIVLLKNKTMNKMGINYIVRFEYMVMGQEVILNTTMIDTKSEEIVSFSTQGDSEDIIHLASEKIVRKLTGRQQVFRTSDSDKTIIRPEKTDVTKILISGEKIYILPDTNVYHEEKSFNFIDSSGYPVNGNLTINLIPTEDAGVNSQIMVIYGYDRQVFTLECEAGKEAGMEKNIGLLKLSLKLNCQYSDRIETRWELSRGDI